MYGASVEVTYAGLHCEGAVARTMCAGYSLASVSARITVASHG